MPYGDDITEGIPYNLSNPVAASQTYNLTGEAYDISINNLPFYVFSSDESPYRRQTAPYRKQQVDQTNEAGEQTFTGWWLRSQSSFHLGTGIKYFEPLQDELLRFQFTESKGVDVWTKGQVSLLNSTLRVSVSTNTNLQMVGAYDATNAVDAVVFIDGPDVKKLTMATDTPTVSTYTLVTSPHTLTFLALTTDGSSYFAADNARIHRGKMFGTTSDGHIYDLNGPVTNVVLRYAKQRLIAGVNAKLYELESNKNPTAGGHNLPTELYTHPNTEWVWTSISEGPAAFYAAGYAGAESSIYKITLDLTTSNTLGFPELNTPSVVVDLPEGEIVRAFDVYLGTYGVICTNKGARVAIVSDNGDISYGPLLFEGDCKAVTFKDKFAYVTAMVGGDSGLIRIDLSQPVVANSLVFPYAWDVYASGETLVPVSTDFLGTTNRAVFSVPGDGIWITAAANKVESGYLTTGRIRYNTLEGKLFKFIKVQVDNADGGIEVKSIGPDNTQYNLGGFAEEAILSELGIPYPTGAQEYLSFKFVLTRSTGNAANGPVFKGYQVKALPAIPRQRLIQYPLACYDSEKDKFGVISGYEGSAYERLASLEIVENVGDSIKVEDYRTGESFIGLIEEVQFINRTPPDKRFAGFGGILLVTIRTL